MWKTKLRKSSKGCFSEIDMLFAHADGTHRGAMSTTLEKIGFGAIWTLVGAGAAAVGSGAYFAERHKDDASEIAQLRSRVSLLEGKNDDLRKDVDAARTSSPFQVELNSCRAEVQRLGVSRNGDVIQEMHRIEAAIADDERHMGDRVKIMINGKEDYMTDDVGDMRRSRRIAENRADLSTLRQKLVCVP